MVDTKGKDLRRIEKRLVSLVEELRPSILALREITNHRLWVAKVNARTEALAREHGIEIRTASRPLLSINSICATRKENAAYLARLFPALKKHLPGERKIWIGEDERMAMFEAVALGVLVLR